MSPRSRNAIFDESIACVPMTMSQAPVASRWKVPLCVASDWKRETDSIRMGVPSKREVKVSKCCSARTVVGARTAVYLPFIAAMNAALIATSVLP